MTWRVARSLDQLLEQLNTAHPDRSKVSDGGIGNAEHASRESDHNPWIQLAGVGIVSARDFTHDPEHGADMALLPRVLMADPRAKYAIFEDLFYDRVNGVLRVRPYPLVNPARTNKHDHHLHLSVEDDVALFDDTRPWALTQEDDLTPAQASALTEILANAKATNGAVAALNVAIRDPRGGLVTKVASLTGTVAGLAELVGQLGAGTGQLDASVVAAVAQEAAEAALAGLGEALTH